MTKIGNRGVTLLEILLVIVIISVLATMLFTGYGSYTKRTRDARRKSDLAQIATAIDQYVFDHKYAPPRDDTIFDCDTSVGLYKKYPGDPNGCDPDYPMIYGPLGSGWGKISNKTLADSVEGGYISKLPVDPINNKAYFYVYKPVKKTDGALWGPACGYDYCRYLLQAGSEVDKLNPIQMIR